MSESEKISTIKGLYKELLGSSQEMPSLMLLSGSVGDTVWIDEKWRDKSEVSVAHALMKHGYAKHWDNMTDELKTEVHNLVLEQSRRDETARHLEVSNVRNSHLTSISNGVFWGTVIIGGLVALHGCKNSEKIEEQTEVIRAQTKVIERHEDLKLSQMSSTHRMLQKTFEDMGDELNYHRQATSNVATAIEYQTRVIEKQLKAFVQAQGQEEQPQEEQPQPGGF